MSWTECGAGPVTARHRTVVPGLWHIGACTHAGPGLGGGSGHLVAEQLTHPGPGAETLSAADLAAGLAALLGAIATSSLDGTAVTTGPGVACPAPA